MKWFNYEEMKVLLFGLVAVIVLGGGSAKADFTFGEPVNLGPAINSSGQEFGPQIWADGLSLRFERCSNWSGPYEVVLATRPTRQDSWNAPVSVGLTLCGGCTDPAVLYESITVIPGLTTSDGLELYFNETGPDSYGGTDLYMLQRQTVDADWGEAVNLGPVVNTSADEISPTISPDGLELYFSGYWSEVRPGGYGNADLWVTTRQTRDDPWTEPVNLGPTVNTAKQDARPCISADGLVLFFDSLRPGGSGSADLYMMRRATRLDTWQKPVNLGPIVNGSGWEECAFPSADGSALFFDTDSPWPGGYGGADIWQAPIIPICDFNGDGNIDTDDLLIMIDNWGTDESLCDIGPMPWGDGIVDIEDLKVFIKYWEQENMPQETDDGE